MLDNIDSQGSCALHDLVKLGRCDWVQSMLETKADPTVLDATGMTALQLALGQQCVPY